MLYIVYKTTNLVNGKIYIGAHATEKEDDGYIGSGKAILRAIKKYGKENFKREVLRYCESKEAMYAYEGTLVTEEFIARDDNYNQMLGGIWTGGTLGYKHTEETKRKISQAQIGTNKTVSEADRVRSSKRMQQNSKDPDFQAKRKAALSTDEAMQKRAAANERKRGRPLSPEHKAKVQAANAARKGLKRN